MSPSNHHQSINQSINQSSSVIRGDGSSLQSDQKEVDKAVESKTHAIACLISALPDDLVSVYAHESITDASVVWKSLVTHFESSTMMNKSHLRTKLSQARMKPDQ